MCACVALLAGCVESDFSTIEEELAVAPVSDDSCWVDAELEVTLDPAIAAANGLPSSELLLWSGPRPIETCWSVELRRADTAGIRQEQLNNKYPENMKHEIREHISFTYQKIIWTFTVGGISGEDDWETPNG
jgi:hypothetical protein